MKNTILLFIAKGIDINRIYYSGAFEMLDKEFNLTIVFPQITGARKISNEIINKLSYYNIEMIPIDLDRIEKWNKVHDLTCFKYREEVDSYKMREDMLRQGAQGDHDFNLAELNYYNSIQKYGLVYGSKVFFWNLYNNIKTQIRRKSYIAEIDEILDNGLYEEYIDDLENEMGESIEMIKLIRKYEPSCILYPTACYDVFFYDLLYIASNKSLPLILLQGGWDSLSSKYKMIHLPSVLGVYGNQGKSHAINIQGMDEEKIKIIGAPHYAPLFKNNFNIKSKSTESLMRKGNLKCLFGGGLRPFDETSLLINIENAINNKVLPPMEIIYRPHPFRMVRLHEQNFNNIRWKHVKMDSDVKDYYDRSKIKSSTLTNAKLHDFDYLYNLYRNIDFIITPMSTIVLEALICGIPFIPLAFGDDKHAWSTDQVVRMTHFHELKMNDKILWCKSSNDLIDLMVLAIKKCDDNDYKRFLRSTSEQFVDNSNNYLKNLYNLLSDFIPN